MKKNLIPLFAFCLGALAFDVPCASAAEPKRVIVVTVTTGFRHSSIETAERTLQKLADQSGEFRIVEYLRQPSVVVPKKPAPPKALPADANDAAKKAFEKATAKYKEQLAQWTPEVAAEAQKAKEEFDAQVAKVLSKLAPDSLEKEGIDGVIFANTTGDLPLPDNAGFIQWVEKGHGFMAMHSASDTFHGFAPYIEMLGGEFAGHGKQSPMELVGMDATHPAVKEISSPWSIQQEEMYHLKNYEKSRVRDLWISVKFPMDGRPDEGQAGHFPVSWVREPGKGRVFYTSLGHREDMWDDNPELPNRINSPEVAKSFQKHILGGIRWALGIARR